MMHEQLAFLQLPPQSPDPFPPFMHTSSHQFKCHEDTCTDELFWQLVGKTRLLAEAAVQEAAWEVEQERIIAEKLATLSKGNVAVVEVRLKRWLLDPLVELSGRTHALLPDAARAHWPCYSQSG